jgi:hypothetical protein
MQRSFLMPFFWAKLVAPSLFLGVIASGCSAGAGKLEGRSGEEPTLYPTAPTTNTPTAPTITPTSATSAAPATNPATNTGNGNNAASTPPAANAAETAEAAGNAGNEALPTPERDEGAVPPANNPGGGADQNGNPDANQGDAADDEADDADDNGGDDDADDDDNGGDDDDDNGGDDDGGDDDDDDTGVTPSPNPPAPNPPAPNPGSQTPAPDAVTFTADVRPILLTNCGRCHANGGLPQFANANAATGFDVAFRERNRIVSEIRSGNMPADTCRGAPGSNGCVSVADFNLIQQWVAAGAPE